jgi:TetR/AcrR family transcriptional repressor of nem operon
MSKAQETRQRILQQAAELFNQQGYAGASISDVMEVTGLKKGGIYNHFKSKDALALEAFDYAFQLVQQHFAGSLRGKHHAVDRLQALVNAYAGFLDAPPLLGGCPILNTAVESDDAHPGLRDRAQKAMDSWRGLIHRIVQKGIERGEMLPTVNPDCVATILISTIEGAIMLSKLYGDPIHLKRTIDYLNGYLETLR